MRSLCFVRLSVLTLVALTLTPLALAVEPVLKPGDRVAIIGDSITEQKLYSKYIEAYLLACSGVPDVKVFQFGWSGETAAGFANRAENDLAVFQPTIATTCYGMNDGGYQPYRPEIGANYEANMRSVLRKLEGLEVRHVIVGSPGAVDQHFFRPGQMLGDQPAHLAYNDNLGHLRDIAKKLAGDRNAHGFANVHDAMFQAMQKAQEKLGTTYDVCGRDGFHPGPNGQLVMAYAFLKAMNLDGNIGEITIDMNGQPTASEGHKLTSGDAGKAELESTRWPFCFEGDAQSSAGTRSIAPFLPFNDELNRFTLKVKGLDTPKGVVTWGKATKEFPREQLEAGINLAAEFNPTPFDESFQKLTNAIGQKQNFETFMIKQMITQFRFLPPELKADAELQAALDKVKARLMARQLHLDTEARAQVVPVKHTITVAQLP